MSEEPLEVQPAEEWEPVTIVQPFKVAQTPISLLARPDTPHGLRCLSPLDRLFFGRRPQVSKVHWQIDPTFRNLVIKDAADEVLFHVVEKLNDSTWFCEAPGVIASFFDCTNHEVMRFTPTTKSSAGCCCCACFDNYAFEACIEAPVGQPIGYIRQLTSTWLFSFAVLNSDRQRLMRFKTMSCCSAICCGEVNLPPTFEILTDDGKHNLGRCVKKMVFADGWTTPNAFDLDVSFPRDLDVVNKALLLGGAYLIHIAYGGSEVISRHQ